MTTKSLVLGSLLGILLVFFTSTTAWAAQRTLTADGNGGYYINMPTTGTDTLLVPNEVKTFNIYSDGGKDGFYTPGVDGRLLVTVAAGKTLKMTGRVFGRPFSQYSHGYLSVYDGVDENADTLILDEDYDRTHREYSSGENMFFRFWSTDLPSNNYSGPELEVTVLDPNDLYSVSVKSANHGSVVASVDQATAGTVVTLNATPDDGYVLNYVRYYGDYNDIDVSGGQWYSDNKASFVMPASDVDVMPEFRNVEEDFVLYVEKTGTSTYFIPPAMGLFGIKSERNGTADVYLVLNAPEGKVFQLIGSSNDKDSIYVYDGADANATLIKSAIIKDMGRITGSSRYMTLHYKENHATGTRNGFYVAVLDPNESHNIVVKNSDGGSVVASAGSALVNTTINLSVSPNAGYMLDYVDILDSNGLRVDATGRTWYEGGAISFKMPSTKVEINPVFVRVEDGPTINMPKEGVVEVAIPDTIAKFHVYDDLGKGRSFSTNCKGSLLLTAPDGKRILVEGFLYMPYSANSGRGYLTIYDGSNDAATKLVDIERSEDISRKLTSGENMYINFRTNDHQVGGYEGLDLTVTVDDPNGPHAIAFNTVYNGSINSSLSQATAGTPIIITANPDEGYILDGLQVVDVMGNKLDVEGGTWYSGNTASFMMPQTDVTISATFSELSGTFYLDVVQSGPDSYVIPSGVNKVRLRIMGPQNEKADKSFSLSAPEGYALLMRGDVSGRECEDSLYIYDGSSADGNELLRSAGCSEFNNVVSSGENVVLHYKEMGSRYYPGEAVYMYVNVVDLNAVYNISINSNMDYGNVSSNPESAKGNTHVTLTALPEPGYVLQGIELWSDAIGSIPVKGGYLSNEASFDMPFGDVSVYPQFEPITSEYLSVYMPDTGTLVVNIPEGITSFRIYGSYSYRQDKDAVLVLKAPDGHRVQLGPLWGHLLEKPLRVYDGADSNTTLLFSRTVDAEYENTSIDAPYGRYVSSGEYMTVVHENDGNGFYLYAVILDPNEPHMIGQCNDNNNNYSDDCDWNSNNEDGVVSSAVNSATVNTQVSLSAVPNEGKWLNRIRVKDRFGSIAISGGTWYTSADATFTMPATDVWFEGYYATELTAEGGLTIEKPRDEMLEVEIPDDVESFAINGVRNLSCSSTAPSEPLILNAPVGKIMRLENDYGYEYVSDYSSFKVFNGKIENPVATNAATIDGNVSSGNVLTIIDYPSENEGLIVRLQDVSDSPHKVTVVKKGNCEGSITAGDLDLDEIVVGTIVRMTVNPDEGCVLNDLYVAVGSEDSEMRIPIDGDSWAANGEFSFAMPFEDVYVVATIVDPNAEYAINIVSYNANGTVVSNLSTAKAGDTVSLTITPNDGYSLAAVCVTYDDESCIDVTGGTWYNNDAQFTMPPMEVFVYANFAPEGYVSHTISIPKTGAENIEIPIGVNQFEIVSDATDCSGGYCSDYSYSDNSDGVLTLSAPEGYGFSFYGWYQLADEGDFLEIFDGSDTNGVKLLNLPSTSGNWEYFDKVYTSGRSMTLRFKSNENWNAGGVEIDAYVEKLPDRVVEIPRSSSSTILLSDDVSLVNVFTEKNLDGRYYNNSDGMLTLSAPEGFAFCVYGPARANDDFDSLFIYDGADANAKLITSTSGDEYVDGIYSSGRNISFRFKSNEEGNDVGPQLEVYVLKKAGSGAVAVYEYDDGYKFARIDGLYNGKDTVNIEEDIEVSYVEFVRDFAVTANDSGKYSTVVFPFDFNAASIGGLDDILEFSQMIEENGKLKVEMNRVWCRAGVDSDRDCSSYEGKLKANTPYMLKTYESNISFNNGPVTLKKTEPAVATSGDWQFIGTYAYKKWEKGDTDLGSVYGFAATASNGVEIGQFVKAGSGAFIRPMRAYLKYSAPNGEPRPAPAGHVSVWRDRSNELPEEIEVVVVEGKGRASIGSGESGSEKKTTVIGRINTRTGEFTPVTRTYDLKGRSLNAKPKAKGVYVGKKR